MIERLPRAPTEKLLVKKRARDRDGLETSLTPKALADCSPGLPQPSDLFTKDS